MLTHFEEFGYLLVAIFILVLPFRYADRAGMTKLAKEARTISVLGLVFCVKYVGLAPGIFDARGVVSVNGVLDHLFVLAMSAALISLAYHATTEEKLRMPASTGEAHDT